MQRKDSSLLYRFTVCGLLLFPLAAVNFANAMVYTPGTAAVDSWGQSTYSVPIKTPPGTAGMVPKINLAYSSKDANGFAGVGWTISGLSRITRCASTLATEGTVGGVRLTSADRFCLDGQKLVSVGTGAYGADATEYRTDAESFTKIVSNGTSGSGPSWFKVWTKDGLIAEYGNTTDSRVLASGSQTALQWQVNKVSDRFGNYYAVAYSQDSAAEASKPARIDYTGNAGAGVAPYNSIQFVYAARPDVESFYVGTAKVTRSTRLTNIQTYTGTSLVSDYRLTYDIGGAYGTGSSEKSRVSSITACAADGTCLATITFASTQGGGGLTVYGGATTNLGNLSGLPQYNPSIVSMLPGDFNGDGIQDVFVTDSLGYGRVCYGPTFSPNSCSAPWPYKSGTNNIQIQILDFNGDGISDIAYFTPSGQLGLCAGPNPDPATGAGCVQPAGWGSPFAGLKIIAGDFNGDGKDDLYFWINDPAQAYQGGSACLDLAAQYAGQFPSCFSRAVNGAGYQVLQGDFDGDGMADLLLIGPTGYQVCTGFDAVIGGRPCTSAATATNWRDTAQIVIGDFNGDGIADIAVLATDSAQFCAGPGLIASNNCVAFGPGWYSNSYKAVAGDFNGDGVADLVLAGTAATYFCQGPRVVIDGSCYGANVQNWNAANFASGSFRGHGPHDLLIANGPDVQLAPGATQPPDLLTSATNSAFGTVTTFAYAPITDSTVYTKGTGALYPLQDVAKPLYVVATTSTPNGIGATNSHSYRYEKGHVSLTGRGERIGPFDRDFIGFETTHHVDTALNRETIFSWELGFPHNGRLQQTQIFVSGQLLASHSMQLAENQSFENRPFSALNTEIISSSGLDGKWLSTRYEHTYDTYGNDFCQKLYFDEFDGTYANVKTMDCKTYSNDPMAWLLGGLVQEAVDLHTKSGMLYTQTHTFTLVPGTLSPQEMVTEPSDAQLKTVTDYARDSFGNVVQTTVTPTNMSPRISRLTFDAQGRFTTATTDALGHSTFQASDPRFGLPTSSTDANGLVTSWQYDPFGRKSSEHRPDGTQTTWSYANCPNCATYAFNPYIRYEVVESSTGASDTIRFFDAFDRNIMTSQSTFAGDSKVDSGNIWFDNNGRVIRRYLPYSRTAPTQPYTSTAYDSFGRIATVTAPDGGGTTYTYSAPSSAGPVTTTVRDAKGSSTQYVRTIWGELTQVTDALNGITGYDYDPLGHISKSTDAAGHQRTMTYNKYGWLTNQTDPDMGPTAYSYDALGELVQKSDAKGLTTNYSYDAGGRKISQADATQTGTWTYDTAANGIGRLASSTSSSGNQNTFGYDALGRISTVGTVIDGVSYAFGKGYDAAGRLSSLTYPDGFSIAYLYNAAGYLSEVRKSADNSLIWRAVSVEPAGPDELEYGNSTAVSYSYDANTKRVRTIATLQDPAANVALASNGAVAIASSTGGATTPASSLIDGERAGINWGSGGGWRDNTPDSYPDWVEIDFGAAKNIDRVVVYSLQDNLSSPVEPTDTMTFGLYGATDMSVDAWNGTAWTTIATVTGNSLVKRTISFAAVTTDRIRVNVNHTPSNYSRLVEIEAWTAGATGGVLEGFTYSYDLNGNMISKNEESSQLTESFGYDVLNRLISVGGSTSKTYEFDAIGNIKNKTDVVPYVAGGAYTYQAADKPHAVRQIGSTLAFSYDADGNTTSGPAGRTVTLTAFNLPATIQQGSNVYSWSYDADYRRVKYQTPSSAKVYVRLESAPVVYEKTTDSAGSTQRHIIFVNGQMVAQYTTRSSGQNDMRYFSADNLGSISLVTDELGRPVERLSYDAYGKRRYPNGADDTSNMLQGMTTPYSFTGHEYLDDLMLIHMNGRLYDPHIGRFISADPESPAWDNPQGLNSYSYVMNGPLTRTDPTGFKDCSDDDGTEAHTKAGCATTNGPPIVVGGGAPSGGPGGGTGPGNTGTGPGPGNGDTVHNQGPILVTAPTFTGNFVIPGGTIILPGVPHSPPHPPTCRTSPAQAQQAGAQAGLTIVGLGTITGGAVGLHYGLIGMVAEAGATTLVTEGWLMIVADAGGAVMMGGLVLGTAVAVPVAIIGGVFYYNYVAGDPTPC